MKKKLLSILLSLTMVLTMMPMMTVTAFADGKSKSIDKDTVIEIAENILAAATLDTEAKNTAAGRIMGAWCEAAGRQPELVQPTEESGKKQNRNFMNALNEMIDAIGLSRTDEQAEAIGTMGAKVMEAMGRQPEASGDIKQYAEIITAAILLQTSGDKASAIGTMAASASEAIGRQPEAYGALREATELAVASISIQTSGKKALAIGRIAAAEMEAIGRQPEAAGSLKTTFAILDAGITVKTEKSAAAIGEMGAMAMEAIGRQPEAAGRIRRELEIKLATFQTLDLKKYTVSFETNGGSAIEAVKISKGETVSKPVNPTRAGYVFVNWYADPEFKTVWDFDKQITKETTLYAKWDEDPNTAFFAQMMLNATVQTLKAQLGADEEVTLTWNKNGNATGYEVYAQTVDGAVLLETVAGKNTTKLVTTELASAYTVRAFITNDGKTYYGDESDLAELQLAKAKITSLKSSAKGKAAVKFAKVAGAQTYEVKYKVAGGKWKTATTAKLSKTLKKLTSGKKLSVKVRGVYAAGTIDATGSWSATKTVKVK